MEHIVYFEDELKDDFSGVCRKSVRIDDKYKYNSRGIFYWIGAFVVYRIIMFPIAYIFAKFKYRVKVVNKKILKQAKGSYIYGNHTNILLDAFMPPILSFPRRAYTIVSSENLALRGTKTFMKMVGAIPLPSTISANRGFDSILRKRLEQKSLIMIYPEAHIWPFYTKIRPYKETAFHYPIKHNVACYASTLCYQKRKHSKKPKAVIYLDGPFYPNPNSGKKEQILDLRNQVYSAMVERSKNNELEIVIYKRREKR